MLQSHIPYIFWQEWKSKPWKVLECVQVNTEFAEFHMPDMSGIMCSLLELAWERVFRMVTKQLQALGLKMIEVDFGP